VQSHCKSGSFDKVFVTCEAFLRRLVVYMYLSKVQKGLYVPSEQAMKKLGRM
jgi:hypothetical protein